MAVISQLNHGNLTDPRVDIPKALFDSRGQKWGTLKLIYSRHDLQDNDECVAWLRLVLRWNNGSTETLFEVRSRSLSVPRRATLDILMGRYQLPQGLGDRRQEQIQKATQELVSDGWIEDNILDPACVVYLN